MIELKRGFDIFRVVLVIFEIYLKNGKRPEENDNIIIIDLTFDSVG